MHQYSQKLSQKLRHCIKNEFRAESLFHSGLIILTCQKSGKKQVPPAEKTIDPAPTEFVKYLEKENVRIFSALKLELFNNFFLQRQIRLRAVFLMKI